MVCNRIMLRCAWIGACLLVASNSAGGQTPAANQAAAQPKFGCQHAAILTGGSMVAMKSYLAWTRLWREIGTVYGERCSGSALRRRRRTWARFRPM